MTVRVEVTRARLRTCTSARLCACTFTVACDLDAVRYASLIAPQVHS
jgi:hypothetical protein